MTIKRKIVGKSIASALLVVAVGILSAQNTYRIRHSVHSVQDELLEVRAADDLEGATATLEFEAAGKEVMRRAMRTAENQANTSVRVVIAAAAVALTLSLALGIAEDITSRRTAEAALRQSEAMPTRAQRVANIGSWDWDLRSGKLLWSEQYYRISDLDPLRFTPTYESAVNTIHPDDRAHVIQAVEDALAGAKRFCVEYRLIARDQSVRVVLAQGDVDRDENGNPIRMIGTALDITDRKKAEAALKWAHEELEQRVTDRTAELRRANEDLLQSKTELEYAKEAAESANQAKSGFLANMSHEIRTPMTAILGYADMLLEPGQSESDRLERVQTIRRNGEHLLTILNDILDLSKIEAGKLQVEKISVDPFDLVGDVVSLMRVRAAERGITLDVKYIGEIPRTIQTDPTRLRQILINLIGNAVKFTDSGGVNVAITLARKPGGSPVLEFAVIDSGIGIDPAQIGTLFQPFEQADNSTTRRFGGTGLGLSICKRLSQMLGGDIAVESRPGCGSRFVASIATGDLSGVAMNRESCEVVKAPEPAHSSAPAVHLSGRVLLPSPPRACSFNCDRIPPCARWPGRNSLTAIHRSSPPSHESSACDMQTSMTWCRM